MVERGESPVKPLDVSPKNGGVHGVVECNKVAWRCEEILNLNAQFGGQALQCSWRFLFGLIIHASYGRPAKASLSAMFLEVLAGFSNLVGGALFPGLCNAI